MNALVIDYRVTTWNSQFVDEHQNCARGVGEEELPFQHCVSGEEGRRQRGRQECRLEGRRI